MREILFKAKRLDNDEWVEGNLISCPEADTGYEALIIPCLDSGMYTSDYNPDVGFERWYKINPETICQYTGLTDKNGNKIWENDVVNIDSYSYMEPEDSCYGVVRYSNSKNAFCLDDGDTWIPIYECTGSYTTIYENYGSIFDNPKLLENE